MVTQEIKLKIHEESDLFTPYDPDQKLLSEEVSGYLVRCYANKHRQSMEDYVIHIYSDMPVNEEHVKMAIRNHCEQESNNNKHRMKLETLREIALAIVGLIFLSIWFFLSSSREGVLMEVLSIMGWVAIWEATSIAIIRRPELYFVKKIYEHALKAQIVIHDTESAETEP